MFFSKTKRVRPKIQGKFSSNFFCNFQSIQDQSLRLELISFFNFFLKMEKIGRNWALSTLVKWKVCLHVTGGLERDNL